MKKLYIILFAIGATFTTKAAHEDSLEVRTFQMSFFYPLSTNGIHSTKYTNNVSFNVLYGLNGGLNGVEFGGLINSNLGSVNGIQMAGLANINAKEANGIMMSGIANVVGDTSNSVALAGISNVFGGSSIGLQMAGISNAVNGNFYGGQFAGISNFNNGNASGFQGAGISNFNKGSFNGLQVSGITNLNLGDLNGAQISLINASKNIKGFQLGLINVANSFEKGVPLGLISIVKDGYHTFELSTNEAIYANLSFKLGVDRLYNIFKIGFAANDGVQYMTYGIGLGTMAHFNDKLSLAIDASANHILRPNWNPNLDLLNKLDLSIRCNLGEYFTFFGGPSINIYVAQHDVDTESPSLNVPYTLFQTNWGNQEGSTSIWAGFNAGVGFNF